MSKFGYDQDPALDFCMEVEAIDKQVTRFLSGEFHKDSSYSSMMIAIIERIRRAMDFRVGGNETAISSKAVLRLIDKRFREETQMKEDENLFDVKQETRVREVTIKRPMNETTLTLSKDTIFQLVIEGLKLQNKFARTVLNDPKNVEVSHFYKVDYDNDVESMTIIVTSFTGEE